VVSKIAEIRESSGRLGAMVFITVETSYTNHYNQICALQRSTVIRY
jgi:hydroxyacyl-ACP dehydratase HTD2-like protein with hotdog domain